jgi:hypothetical protein
MSRVRTSRLALVVTSVAIVLTGCGDDDATSGTATATEAATTPAPVTTDRTTTTAAATTAAPAATAAPATTTAGATSFDSATFCDAFLAVDMAGAAAGDPDADPSGAATAYLAPAQAAAALAPPELVDELSHSVELLQQAADTHDARLIEQAFPTATTAWASANCGWTKVTATAEDYHFSGIPASIAAGDYEFDLSNTGTEFHVLLIVTRKPGVTDTFDQLLDDPAAESKLDTVVATAAGPGASASNATHLDPGEYLVLCPVPIGSVGGTQGTGPPHFTAGMHQLLTVVG